MVMVHSIIGLSGEANHSQFKNFENFIIRDPQIICYVGVLKVFKKSI